MFHLVSAGGFKSFLHRYLERGQTRPVQHFDRVGPEIVEEAVVVTIHPGQKDLSSLSPIGAGGLTRLNPPTSEICDKAPELPFRVNLVRLQIAGPNKRFV
jgi:hypothetical protein